MKLVNIADEVSRRTDNQYGRGYTSQSEMWSAGMRLLRHSRRSYGNRTQTPIIFHFGDHDPSGKDMTRDIIDRLTLFTSGSVRLQRLALNMDQVQQYDPPPNPAKITDSRAAGYIAEFGDESWELDALNPTILAALVQGAIDGIIDQDKFDARIELRNQHRKELQDVSDFWSDAVAAVTEI